MAKKKFDFKITSWFKAVDKYEWLVVVLFVIFLLRVPTLFEPHWYGDEEIYLVMGQGLRKGLVFYKDIFDHKPPLIYIVAAMAHNVFYFRLILMAVHAIGVVAFGLLAEKLFKNQKLARLTTLGFALLSTLPRLEGNIANGENFMIVPATIGAYLLYKTVIDKKAANLKTYLLIGLWYAVAFLVKVPIAFDFAGLMLFWWLLAGEKLTLKEIGRKIVGPKIWLLILGFLVPVLISVGYYAYKGAFDPYLRAVLMQNIGYTLSWKSGWEGQQTSALQNPLVWRMLIVLGVTVVTLALAKTKKFNKGVLMVAIWGVWATYGALLSSRPYPHYLLQPLVPVCLLAGMIFDKKKLTNRLLGIGMMVIIGALVVENGFWYYPTINYYKNFAEYMGGQKNYQEYVRFFPAAVEQNYQIAEYVKYRTDDNEKIFVWGEEPAIYDLSDRLPVGKYIVSFHIRDFPNGYEETYQNLINELPRYMVVFPNQVPAFPEIEALIQSDYVLVNQIGQGLIYRLLKA